MTDVVPAIIPADLQDLYAKANKVRDYVDIVQVDIMDGKFAPSKSWPYNNLQEFENLVEIAKPLLGDLMFDVDMMVADPEDSIDEWITLGARALIIHTDSTEVIDDVIARIKEKGVAVGIALRPYTDNEVLERIVPKINFVQFMGNQKIGYHGIGLDENVLEKIRDARKRFPNLVITVDIGVNFETAPRLVEAGVNKLVSGSTIFKSENIGEAIQKLKQS